MPICEYTYYKQEQEDSKITDPEIKELLNTVRNLLKLKKDSFIITQRFEITSLKGFSKDETKITYNFNTIKEPVYQIYYEVAPLEYQCINLGAYDKKIIMAYMYGMLYKH